MALWRGIPAFLTCNLPSRLNTRVHSKSPTRLSSLTRLPQVTFTCMILYLFMLAPSLWNPWTSTISCPQPYFQNSLEMANFHSSLGQGPAGVSCQRWALDTRTQATKHPERWDETELLLQTQSVPGWVGCLLGVSKLHCYNLVYREVWYLTWDFKSSRFCDTWHIELPGCFVDLPLFFSLYFSFFCSNIRNLTTCFLEHFLTRHEIS